MTSIKFVKFDSLLNGYDSDSMDWCDGGGCELAIESLENFSDADWVSLNDCWKYKDGSWKGCLISALFPKHGEVAKEIIIEMAFEEDLDIAFAAMQKISFYCGINSNSEGVFYDNGIADKKFLEKVKGNSLFIASIPKIGSSVGRRYEFLTRILVGMP